MDLDFNLSSAIELLSERLNNWFEVVIKNIPNLLVAIIVLIVFFMLSKLVRLACEKFLRKVTKNPAVFNLLKSTLSLVVILLGLFISLEIVNLEKTVTSLLAGAGVLGLALGFAFQEIASNFVAGILIALKEPYKVGDIIEVESFFGEVTSIDLRTTSVTTFQGLEILIPNKMLFTKPFTNFTTTPKRRLDVSVGVSYSDDLDKVEKVTKEALEGIIGRTKHDEVEVFFESFGASSIDLSARVWVKYPHDGAYLKARHEAIMNIKKAYDKNGISIPFPIRTLDIDSKIVETLGARSDKK